MDAQKSEDTWWNEGASVSHTREIIKCLRTGALCVYSKILNWAVVVGGAVLLLGDFHLWKIQGFVCWCNSAGWRTRVTTVRDVMKVKRVFLVAMFCCCILISRLLQIRSVDDPYCPMLFFYLFTLYIYLWESFSTVWVCVKLCKMSLIYVVCTGLPFLARFIVVYQYLNPFIPPCESILYR